MFSRRPDRPGEEPRLAPPPRPSELAPVPASDQRPGVWGSAPVEAGPAGAGPGSVAGEVTVIAERDHVEGVLRSGQGVLVLGSFSGSIESETWVRLGEGSRVQADVTAEEVVVAGRYEGRLVARSRLEIAATGHIQGDIEAPRLQLHEGGVIDGALSMTTRATDRRAGGGGRGGPATGAEATPEVARPEVARPGVSPRSRGATSVPLGAPAEARGVASAEHAPPELPSGASPRS